MGEGERARRGALSAGQAERGIRVRWRDTRCFRPASGESGIPWSSEPPFSKGLEYKIRILYLKREEHSVNPRKDWLRTVVEEKNEGISRGPPRPPVLESVLGRRLFPLGCVACPEQSTGVVAAAGWRRQGCYSCLWSWKMRLRKATQDLTARKG